MKIKELTNKKRTNKSKRLYRFCAFNPIRVSGPKPFDIASYICDKFNKSKCSGYIRFEVKRHHPTKKDGTKLWKVVGVPKHLEKLWLRNPTHFILDFSIED